MRKTIPTLLLVAAALGVAVPSGAVPVCSDLLMGVNERCPVWTGTYNNPGGAGGDLEDTGFAVAVTPDATKVVVTGRSRDDATDRDQATVAFNAATGATLWTARYDDGFGRYDVGSAVSATDTRVFVTGRSQGEDGSYDWATVAYDAATGVRLWAARVAGDEGLDDFSWTVVTSADGSTVYVGGGVDDGAEMPGDALVVAYDAATGDERWRARYDSGFYDGGFRLFRSPGGDRLFLAGGTRRGNDSMNYLALGIEAEDPEHLGDIVWSSFYASGQGHDEIRGAALSPDGTRLVVTGYSISGVVLDVNTAAFDTADGSLAWSARYNGTRNAGDEAGGVAIAAGNAVVTMKGAEGTAGFDYATRAYDLATGAVVWTKYEGTPATPDSAYAITALGDAVYVTGYVPVPRGEIQPVFKIEPATMMTVSYDAATGNRRWIAQANNSGVGADIGVAIAAGGGKVYPAGTFATSGVYFYPVTQAKAYAWDYGVLAYPA